MPGTQPRSVVLASVVALFIGVLGASPAYAKAGDLVFTLTGHSSEVISAEYSPDGAQILTASSDSTAKVWEAKTGKLLYTLTGHSNRVISAAYSHDGAQIVTVSEDSTAKVWTAR
jgi:WD40 repeat protein